MLYADKIMRHAKELTEEPKFGEEVRKEVVNATQVFQESVESDAIIAVTIRMCKHPEWAHEYYNDPSGNNGGGWVCGICEKSL